MIAQLTALAGRLRLGSGTPGFASLITKGGDQVLLECSGVRDNDGDPITAATNFRIASVSKQFTAVAILQLVESGRLTLETSIREVIPQMPEWADGITIHHLLTHTSGIVEADVDISGVTGQVSDAQMVGVMSRMEAPAAEPGTTYSYCNPGYSALAVVVARISGGSFANFITTEVFAKAGMENSRLNDSADIPLRVYGFAPEGGGWRLYDQSKTSATQGDGGVYTSVQELARWQTALYKDFAVIPEQLVESMTTAHVATEHEGESYGYGIALAEVGGERCYLHRGESAGFEHALFYLPDEDVGIALLSNLGTPDLNMTDVGKEIVLAHAGALF